MQGTMRLQEWIHRMEEGGGAKYVRWLGLGFGFVMLALVYNALCFRNFTNIEAMDAAQLGRQISRGQGFTTLFVRPLSVSLTREARADKSGLLKEGHRDISNPPLYPLLLAAVLKITPEPSEQAVAKGGIYLPNLYIAITNQLLFGFAALLVFRLALRWFDHAVAWIATLLFLFTELYWRFTISGLNTMLVMDLILLLVWQLSQLEQRAREGNAGGKPIRNAVAIGALVGFAMLARYSMIWLIVPVLIFVAACGANRRWALFGATLVAFIVVAAPWLFRNMMASGLPFGTATYAVVEGMADTLPRTLAPSFTSVPGQLWSTFVAVLHKGMTGVREIIISDLPRMGGNWLWGFFLVGLLVRFQGASLSRVRWFVVGTLVLLIPVQALARTHLAAEAPEVNSENLLVLFSPLVLLFGVGLFFVLFESLAIPSAALRMGALVGFLLVISIPLLLAFFPPRPQVNAAPYYPPRIRQLARYLDAKELWMSDIPWAVAWYGERQAIWLSVNPGRDFFELSDFYKTVNGLYVSSRTADAKFISNWFAGPDRSWASFLLQTFVLREVPRGFPLRDSPEGLTTLGELVLMDRDRWSEGREQGKFLKKD